MAELLGPSVSGRIVGRYLLCDEIAAGGMAAVHLGRLVGPVGFSRTVAIKRLHPQLAKDPEFTERFLEEARLTARIRHPNVVSVIDIVTVGDELFLVMEYVHGESLARLARRGRTGAGTTAGAVPPIPLGISLTIVADALYGLHAAHETKGESGEPLAIVHRDVSPQNIIVGIDGVARVLDFGIAKAASQDPTQSEVVKGKLAYLSPEQLTRRPVDRRADVFAASIVLWEVLTGVRMFAGAEPGAIIHQVLHEQLDRPSKHVPDLPAALDDIVMKGLARDPDARFATAHEMAAAIEATKLLVRPPEIGAWVERTAPEALQARAGLVARIEGDASTASFATLSSGASPAGAGGEPTMTLHDQAPADVAPSTSLTGANEGASAVRRTRARTPRSRAVVAVVAAVTLGLVVVVGVRSTGRGAASASAPSNASAALAEATGSVVASSVASVASTSEAPASLPAGSPSSRPVSDRPAAKTAPAVPSGASTRKRGAPRRDADCNPPYYFDADQVKRFKPQCL